MSLCGGPRIRLKPREFAWVVQPGRPISGFSPPTDPGLLRRDLRKDWRHELGQAAGVDRNAEGSAHRSTSDRQLDAARLSMQIGTTSGCGARHINRDVGPASHQPDQLGLRRSTAAPDTHPDRLRHRDNLARLLRFAAQRVAPRSSSPDPGSAMPRWASAVTRSGSTALAASITLVFTEPPTTLVVPLSHRRKALTGDLSGIVLAALADLGVGHLGPVEEFSLCWPGHQRGHGDPGAGELGLQRLTEGLQKRLARVVDRREGPRHGGRDRGRDQDLALSLRHHVDQHPLGQLHRGGDVELDQRSSAARSVSTNRPPWPTPAFSAAEASGRPVASTAAYRASTAS